LSLLKDGICQDNTIITSIDNEISQVATVLRDMGDWSNVFEGALVDVQNTLQQAENVVSKEIIEVVDVVEGYMTISWIMIVMLIFASLLLIGELVAWCKPRSYRLSGLFCVLSWVILPLFMFSLALSVFLACLCGFVLVFNSGKCLYEVRWVYLIKLCICYIIYISYNTDNVYCLVLTGIQQWNFLYFFSSLNISISLSFI
jgi:hypothetical protein